MELPHINIITGVILLKNIKEIRRKIFNEFKKRKKFTHNKKRAYMRVFDFFFGLFLF